MKKFWTYLVIIFVVCGFFWKTLFLGQIPFPGDFVVGIYYPWLDYKWGYQTGVPVKNPIVADVPSYMYPMQTFAANLMKKGSWPLWNPIILAGVPLLANFQSAPFSPTTLFYFVFSNTAAWSLQIISAHFLAAFFTFLLLREWKVSKSGSILGGIIFAFSGYNLIWSQWNGHTLAAAFIPLILFFEDKWLSRRNVYAGIGLAIAFCLQIFSGYPQTVIYTAVAVGLLWLVRISQMKKIFLTTVLLIFFFVLGIGLAAPQVLTGAELLKLSQWTAEQHPFSWAFLPWQKIITFLAPDFFGNHVTQNYWGPQDYTSNTGYVGVVAFILTGFAMFFFKERKEVKFSLLLLVITLMISFPTFISVFLWKNNLLGMGSSSAHRALVLFNLSVALLSGFGIDSLTSRFKEKLKFKSLYVLVVPGIIILIYGIYALNLKGIFIRGIPVTQVALRNLVIPSIILFLTFLVIITRLQLRLFITALVIFELFRFGWKFTPFSSTNLVFPKTPVLEFLGKQEKPFRITGSGVVPVNLSMPYGFESLEGYETMRPYYISRLIASINNNSSTASPAGRYGIMDNDTSRLLDLVNTRYYLTRKLNKNGDSDPEGTIPSKFDQNRFSIAFEDKSVAVLESNTTLPRAFMVYDWEVEGDNTKVLNRLLDPNFSFSTKIVLEESPFDIPFAVTLPVKLKEVTLGKGVTKVDYEKYGEQESVMKVETADDGMLFVSDAYYPGWKAYVDGRETKIHRADFAFRAVEIPAGIHKVEFVYKPESFYKGVKISIISLIFLSVLASLSYLIGKKVS